MRQAAGRANGYDPAAMALSFVKMQGTGNDYVYIDGLRQDLPDDLPELARRISDRHFGVGGDGLICLLPPTDAAAEAHVRMRMFNNDGSESEMCGNGIRCVAKFAHDYGLSIANPLKVETGRGVLSLDLQLGADGKIASATVDMREPILELEQIPVNRAMVRPAGAGSPSAIGAEQATHVWNLEVTGHYGSLPMTFVSMGNPHAVIVTNSLDEEDLELARVLERHAAFPRRMNIHFVRRDAADELTVVHWERGAGATLACGTGACAAVVACALRGIARRDARVNVPGGQLRIRWDEASNHVFMTGPAVEVFRGEWNG